MFLSSWSDALAYCDHGSLNLNLKHTLQFSAATNLLGFPNRVVFHVLGWPDGQLKLTYFCYRLKEPQAHGSTISISRNRLLSCADWNTGKQIYITVLRLKPLVSAIILLWLTFYIQRGSESCWFDFSVEYVQTRSRHWTTAWEAGTKWLHKKSSWAPHYYLCIPGGRAVSWHLSRESEILSWENTSGRAAPT